MRLNFFEETGLSLLHALMVMGGLIIILKVKHLGSKHLGSDLFILYLRFGLAHVPPQLVILFWALLSCASRTLEPIVHPGRIALCPPIHCQMLKPVSHSDFSRPHP
jgi:hypothetical protein